MHKVGDIIAPKAPQNIASAGLDDGILTDLVVKLVVHRCPIHHRLGRQAAPHLSGAGFQSPGEAVLRGIDRATLADLAGQFALQDHATGPRSRLASDGGVRLHRPGAGQPGFLCGDAALAIREHAAGAAGTTWLPPSRAWSCRRRPRRWLAWPFPPDAACSSTGRPGTGKAASAGRFTPRCRAITGFLTAISVGESVIRLFDEHIHQRVEIPGERADSHRSTLGSRSPSAGRRRRRIDARFARPDLHALACAITRPRRTSRPTAACSWSTTSDASACRPTSCSIASSRRWSTRSTISRCTRVKRSRLPLRHVLIIATNLSPETVTDPAFLRRMGYRVYLGAPTPEQYAKIFQQYAQKRGRHRRARVDRAAAGALPLRRTESCVVVSRAT